MTLSSSPVSHYSIAFAYTFYKAFGKQKLNPSPSMAYYWLITDQVFLNEALFRSITCISIGVSPTFCQYSSSSCTLWEALSAGNLHEDQLGTRTHNGNCHKQWILTDLFKCLCGGQSFHFTYGWFQLLRKLVLNKWIIKCTHTCTQSNPQKLENNFPN